MWKKKFSVGGEAFYRIPIITAESVNVVSLYKTAEFKALLSPVPSAMAEACVFDSHRKHSRHFWMHPQGARAGGMPAREALAQGDLWFLSLAILSNCHFAILQQQMVLKFKSKVKNKICHSFPKVNRIIVKRPPAGSLKVCGKQGKGYLPLCGAVDVQAHWPLIVQEDSPPHTYWSGLVWLFGKTPFKG